MKNYIKEYYSQIFTGIVTFLITSFVYMCYNNYDFVGMFSFGATVSSIILSVIAIIYTLVQSQDSNRISSKINDSTDSIQTTAEKLEKITKDIEAATNNLKGIEELKIIMNNLETNVSSGNQTNKEKFKILEEMAITSTGHATVTNKESNYEFKLSEKLISKGELESLLYKFPMYVRSHIFFLYMCYQQQKYVNIEEYNEFYKAYMIADDIPPMDISEDIKMVIFVLAPLNIIKYTLSGDEIFINDFNGFLKEALLESSPEKLGGYIDSPHIRMFEPIYKFFNVDLFQDEV
ncbi:hypothetical protein KPL47_22875 [Clostridium estertheticum]|uniref:hypothetical protein n=1 Tax=Clostridium TaxID=1485 RepID=UPI001C0DC978|nr:MULTISPECIES: hypothetical protein [Clostridium]MBU3146511.1 hypothetical protein [Clostridium sp. CF012]MBU3179142.1 hypothetical protein [Clostridium estertheticum]